MSIERMRERGLKKKSHFLNDLARKKRARYKAFRKRVKRDLKSKKMVYDKERPRS